MPRGRGSTSTHFAEGRGAKLNRNQKAAARQLSLAAYLLFFDGRPKDEASIRENLPLYRDLNDAPPRGDEDTALAADALRKQLARDVQALAVAGIRVGVDGTKSGRSYRLSRSAFSSAEIDLTDAERAVLVGALRTLRRDFPYSGPLHLAIANLIGAASTGVEAAGYGGAATQDGRAFAAAVATRDDESISRRVSQLESAVSRRKRVRFDYYSISRDETSGREVEPYALSLLDGIWYATGWDVGREAVRQFRLSRIRGRVTFATRRDSGDFEVTPDFGRHVAGPRAPWQLGEPVGRASVRVSEEIFDAVGRELPDAFSKESGNERGNHILSTAIAGERQFAAWILSKGKGAKALSPPSLVRRVEEALGAIASAHAAGRP